MIYIFTALYCEARILIRHFDLVKNTENTWFQEFYNETAGIRLTVTGAGEIAAAAAVGSACSIYRPGAGDVLLNVGTCAYAAESEGIFLCNKITEQATGRTFYPDMLYRFHFHEKAIVTGMLLWNSEKACTGLPEAVSAGKHSGGEDVEPWSETAAGKHSGGEAEELWSETAAGKYSGGEAEELWSETAAGKYSGGIDAEQWSETAVGKHSGGESAEAWPAVPAGSLYDMEAAAVYQAGSSFFGPHQMLFLKVVSDGGTAKEVSREQIERRMEKYQDCIFDLIERISVLTRMARRGGQGEERLTQEGEELIETFCADMHCSRAMRDSVRQHIRYLSLAGTDYTFAIRDMYEKGLLPCRDKREGKLRVEEFRKRVF